MHQQSKSKQAIQELFTSCSCLLFVSVNSSLFFSFFCPDDRLVPDMMFICFNHTPKSHRDAVPRYTYGSDRL
jgi:hypothetical protein